MNLQLVFFKLTWRWKNQFFSLKIEKFLKGELNERTFIDVSELDTVTLYKNRRDSDYHEFVMTDTNL